jgi:hypothetical protein
MAGQHFHRIASLFPAGKPGTNRSSDAIWLLRASPIFRSRTRTWFRAAEVGSPRRRTGRKARTAAAIESGFRRSATWSGRSESGLLSCSQVESGNSSDHSRESSTQLRLRVSAWECRIATTHRKACFPADWKVVLARDHRHSRSHGRPHPLPSGGSPSG